MFDIKVNALLVSLIISGVVIWNLFLHDKVATLEAKYQELTNAFTAQQTRLTHDLTPLHNPDEESLANCILRKTNGRERYNAVEELVTPADLDYFGQDIIIKRKDCQRIINQRFNY